jgi:hypothetical protein
MGATKDDGSGFDELKGAQILSFEGEIEVDCPKCGRALQQTGKFEGGIVNWKCACGAEFQSQMIAAPLPRYRPE